MLRANSSLKMSRVRDNQTENVGTQLEQNHTEVMGMFAYNFSHYLFSCNSEGKSTPSNSCSNRLWKMSLPGPGELPAAVSPSLGSPAQFALIAKPRSLQRPSSARLWSQSGGFMQGLLLVRTRWGDAAQTAHEALWYHFYWACCYVSKHVLGFVDTGVVFFLLSHFSTGTVILFTT